MRWMHIWKIAYFKDLYPKLYKIDKMRFCIACIYFYQETFKLNDKEKRECKNRIKSSRHSIRFNCSELKQYFKRKYQYSWQSCMYWIIESVNVIKKE